MWLTATILDSIGLNIPSKSRYCQAESKGKTQICCLQKVQLKYKDTGSLEIKTWKKINHTNTNFKEVGVAIYNIRKKQS